MRDFDYEAPTSVAEAVRVLAEHNSSARPLAGGTDLIDQIRTGRHQPEVVVDLKKIPELSVFELSAKGLRLGAAVPCYRIYGDAGVVQAYAALADSTRIIGGIQIQSRASVGGNLCNSGPAADSTPSLIALGAVAVIAGPRGQREVAVDDFCTGRGKTAPALAEKTSSQLIMRVGNVAVLYRRLPAVETAPAVSQYGSLRGQENLLGWEAGWVNMRARLTAR